MYCYCIGDIGFDGIRLPDAHDDSLYVRSVRMPDAYDIPMEDRPQYQMDIDLAEPADEDVRDKSVNNVALRANDRADDLSDYGTCFIKLYYICLY